jgi:hypothetical protein
MTQKCFLARHPKGAKLFEWGKLRATILPIPGVTNWQESPHKNLSDDVLLECDVMRAEEGVMLRVFKDMQAVSIEAHCDLGLQVALEIYRNYGDEILVFAEESSPEMIPLSTVGTASELAKRLRLRE